MPRQGLGGLRRCPGANNARNVGVPQSVEIGHKPGGVAVGKEVALLGLRLLAGILERFEPPPAGFLQIPPKHVGGSPFMPLAGPNGLTGRLVGKVAAQGLCHFPPYGLRPYLSFLSPTPL